jgi:glycine oxidase
MPNFDVAIAGGGIIGGAIAWELQRAGRRVVLLDRQQPGQEASWAAAGILSPSFEVPDAIALVPLARASLNLYPEFVAGVEQVTGRVTGLRYAAALQIFFGKVAQEDRDALIAAHRGAGLASKAISTEDARRLEPALNAEMRAAALLPDEGRIDTRQLNTAVLDAARSAGVEIRAGVEVTGLVLEARRCTGVLAGGERISAAQVVIAAGCYCGHMQAVARYAPTRPVRGQMVAFGPTRVKTSRVVNSERGYLVPREDGRVLAGSTLEDAGFEKAVTPAGLQKILAAALEIAPDLAGAPIVETWSGLRPDTPDHLPIVGPTDVAGLWMATGHFRNGILLAPITARVIREWMDGKALPVSMAEFSPMRFSEKSQSVARN